MKWQHCLTRCMVRGMSVSPLVPDQIAVVIRASYMDRDTMLWSIVPADRYKSTYRSGKRMRFSRVWIRGAAYGKYWMKLPILIWS